ncbi:MAG: transglycosylase domain-containing protein [Patescibacteria group bacterium]
MSKKHDLFGKLRNPLNIKKLLTPHRKKKFTWKTLGKYALYALGAFVVFIIILFVWYAKDLPTPSKIASQTMSQSTKLYDRTGNTLLYETGNEKRTIVKSDQFSDNLKKATVAVEDSDFYSNHGFSIRGIMSAVWQKVSGKTVVMRGGSTITQQYVKNALLTSDRSFSRKVKELILSIELEFMYNKDEILTMYLNEIPYGNSTAGAEAASAMYYGIPAKDLDLSQAATIAAIPQAPTYYSPYGTHTNSLINRKNYVLDRMVDTKVITKEQADAAKAQDTTTVGTIIKPRKDNLIAPHFAMYVLQEAVDEYGEQAIQNEGLSITTTLDYDKQKIAEDAITAGMPKVEKYGGSNGALVSVDTKTGQILTMVGSKDYYDTSIDGNVNVTDSLRQPGSSFKPYVYATALKSKEFSPARTLFDLTTDFGGGYVPHDYDGSTRGPVTLRQALDNSLNIPAVKTLSLAGIDNVIETAKSMGVTSLNDRDKYGLSFALGTAEIRPVEMAGAFATFATNGIHHDVKSILKVTDSHGKLLYEYKQEKDKGNQALDPQIAYEMSNILSDNQARSLVFGTRSPLAFSGKTIGAKTGTTSDFKDAWTVGFSKSIATAVWVGNNNNTKMSSGADGVVVAAPIFHTYMDKVVTADEPFDKPEGIQTVTVDRFSMKLPTDQTTETITDIFASWQVPTEKDATSVSVKVCKSNGLLAGDDVNEALTEYRSYRAVHSERPDNPNWEGPVRSWAEAHGYANFPPTEKCNPGDASLQVTINTPGNGDSVSGSSSISASVNGTFNIKDVTFYIDDISIGSDDSTPYAVNFDFDNLSEGNHTISAIATDVTGTTSKDTISIISSKSPPTISAIDAQVSGTSVTITWTTNKESSSQVLYGLTNALGSSSSLDPNNKTSHSVKINGLSPGKKYYFQVKSGSATSDIKNFQT